MRVALTVVSPAMRRTADVLLEADPATPIADIAAELASVVVGDVMERHHASNYGGGQQGARVLRFPGPGANGPLALSSPLPSAEWMSVPLYVNHRQIPPQLSLAEAWIRDGAVVSLGDPDGCVSPEQAGLVEVRAMSGPMAGAIWRLGAGHWDIGSGHGTVRLGDPAVPAAALRVFVDGREIRLGIQERLVAVEDSGLVGVEDGIHPLLLFVAQANGLDHVLVVPPSPDGSELQCIMRGGNGAGLFAGVSRLSWPGGAG